VCFLDIPNFNRILINAFWNRLSTLLDFLSYSAPMFSVFITTNPTRTIFFVGYTSNLLQEMQELLTGPSGGAHEAGRYDCFDLVYWEDHQQITYAALRADEIRRWPQQKKLALVRDLNPKLLSLNAAVLQR
jgi:putative endonuclease